MNRTQKDHPQGWSFRLLVSFSRNNGSSPTGYREIRTRISLPASGFPATPRAEERHHSERSGNQEQHPLVSCCEFQSSPRNARRNAVPIAQSLIGYCPHKRLKTGRGAGILARSDSPAHERRDWRFARLPSRFAPVAGINGSRMPYPTRRKPRKHD